MQVQAKAQEAPSHALAPPSPRQDLLRTYVDGYVGTEDTLEYLGYGGVVFGLGGLALGIAAYEDDRRFSVTAIAGYGVGTAAFIASLGTSSDVRAQVLRMHFHYTATIASLSIAVAEDQYTIPRITAAALAGAYLFAGVIEAINGFSRTPTSMLRTDGELLRYRGRIPDAELALIERRLLGTQSVVPHVVAALPYCLAAPVAFIPLLDDSTTDREQTWVGILGSLTAVACLVRSAGRDAADRYKDDLGRAGLQLLTSPQEVGVHYTF